MSNSRSFSAFGRSLFKAALDASHIRRPSGPENNRPDSLTHRFLDVFLRTWDLGFTAFGGPPVHFQILHKRLVERHKWLDEQTYQELFAICQSLPGPGSTKMGFCIVLSHAGFLPALLYFVLWSLPGAIGMFLVAFGVSRVTTTLPDAVYALLSGSNAATVGIVAAAAMQLSQKAITDGMTRCIVIFGACAGLIYNALWYFPALMIFGSILTLGWDAGARKLVFKIKRRLARAFSPAVERSEETSAGDIELSPVCTDGPPGVVQEMPPSVENTGRSIHRASSTDVNESPRPVYQTPNYPITLSMGLFIVIGFFISFIAIVVVRGVLRNPPVDFKLFSNLYLAGTIIFGGGPVVIPLLREYVVSEGWVSSRDFLIGLAVIQAFPGPNFNFAVYLAALSSRSANSPAILTAFLGFVGIFFPGISLAVGFSPIWNRLRRYGVVISLLRGINATAVGLVWTAVYRLWEIGYLKADATSGISLGLDPWWVVVAVMSFSSNRWFDWPAPLSILLGATMGVAWWGAVGR